MGRKRKYFTPEEKRRADCNKSMKYYEKNKNKIKRKNLKRYYKTINH